jgi:hypothetical protein
MKKIGKLQSRTRLLANIIWECPGDFIGFRTRPSDHSDIAIGCGRNICGSAAVHGKLARTWDGDGHQRRNERFS